MSPSEDVTARTRLAISPRRTGMTRMLSKLLKLSEATSPVVKRFVQTDPSIDEWNQRVVQTKKDKKSRKVYHNHQLSQGHL